VPDLVSENAFARHRLTVSSNDVIATERVGLAIATVMARRGKRAELSGAVKNLFGIKLPTGATWAAESGVTFLGTGPGKWLAIDDWHSAAFVQTLETKLQGLASVVEQSGGLGVLRLAGPALPETLEKGVQIDLAPNMFPVGSVAVTSIAHIGATLWKVDAGPTIEIAVARSLVGSFFHWLELSASTQGLSTQRHPD
jgi:sarcosine oxidase subunit gamma